MIVPTPNAPVDIDTQDVASARWSGQVEADEHLRALYAAVDIASHHYAHLVGDREALIVTRPGGAAAFMAMCLDAAFFSSSETWEGFDDRSALALLGPCFDDFAELARSDQDTRRISRMPAAHRRVHTLGGRDGWDCYLCGEPLVDVCAHNGVLPRLLQRYLPNVEHVVPRALGGSNGLDNLRLSCWPCNARKGAQ